MEVMIIRKDQLRMNKNYKYEIIKKLIESDGNKKSAAIKLKCSMRYLNHLIEKYHCEGMCGFVHGNRGKKPSTTFDSTEKQKIIDLYISDYGDTNFSHFCEIVNEDLGYSISDTTLNRWLREQEIISPKAKRKTKRNMKKLLKAKLDITKSEKVKNEIKESIAIIDSKDALMI